MCTRWPATTLGGTARQSSAPAAGIAGCSSPWPRADAVWAATTNAVAAAGRHVSAAACDQQVFVACCHEGSTTEQTSKVGNHW